MAGSDESRVYYSASFGVQSQQIPSYSDCCTAHSHVESESCEAIISMYANSMQIFQ